MSDFWSSDSSEVFDFGFLDEDVIFSLNDTFFVGFNMDATLCFSSSSSFSFF